MKVGISTLLGFILLDKFSFKSENVESFRQSTPFIRREEHCKFAMKLHRTPARMERSHMYRKFKIHRINQDQKNGAA
jgi:hypothetical protein